MRTEIMNITQFLSRSITPYLVGIFYLYFFFVGEMREKKSLHNCNKVVTSK